MLLLNSEVGFLRIRLMVPPGPPAPGEQAGGALEHFDAVVDRHVSHGLACRVLGVAQGRNAVVLEVLDGETTRVIVGALGVIGRHRDAWRVAHYVIDGVEAEVIHDLACDHRDRLWCFPWCQHQARGRGDGARGIRARAFGDRAELVGADLGGLQLHLSVLGQRLGDHAIATLLALRLQARLAQQALQAFVHREITFEPFALNAGCQRRINADHHARLLPKGPQYTVQATGRNVIRTRLGLLLGRRRSGGHDAVACGCHR